MLVHPRTVEIGGTGTKWDINGFSFDQVAQIWNIPPGFPCSIEISPFSSAQDVALQGG